MNKNEFLKGLEEALLENMDISQAAPHIKYYNDYIDSEIEKGKSEAEVIASLQSPRLIAKSIIDNRQSAGKYDNNIKDKRTDKTKENNSQGSGVSFSINGKPINNMLVKIIALLFVIIAIFLVVAIVSGILWFLFKIILPVIIIAGAVIYITKIFSNSSKWK